MQHLAKGEKIVIGMVGLPARGKTHISRKMARYLNWSGLKCEVFNIGQYRRDIYGTRECTANFFDNNNTEATKARTECAMLALKDLIKFLEEEDGDVAIYDGTNTTVERRQLVKETLEKEYGACQLMWVESICNDESIIENNIKLTKLSSPDYKETDPEQATKDFKSRIQKYTEVYEELSREKDGPDTSFIKLYDVGQQFEMNKINGYLQSRIVAFLMNLHITPRPIYFVRHGESVYNVENRIGGDPELTEKGATFAKRLNRFFISELNQKTSETPKKVKIFTSTMKRATATANALELSSKPVYLKSLDELSAGVCDGMTYHEIDEMFPLEYKDRKTDKLNYRYPRGESYMDLIHRVEPIIFEIERSKDPVIVVAHQGVLRCLYAYFSKHEIKEVPFISIPLHTVIKLIPETYYAHEFRYTINVEDERISKTKVNQPLLIDDHRSVKV